MKTILSSRRDHYLAKFSIFLITVALVAAMAGCAPERWNLTISSTPGGEVSEPGEGTYRCDKGNVVSLVAEPDEGYQFVEWTGDVDTIADVNAATTKITMDGDYSIKANFAVEILKIRTWNDLDSVRDKLGGNCVLMNDLDFKDAGWDEWVPIEDFDGIFDGQDDKGDVHTIDGLFIDSSGNDVGLFGSITEEAVIKNVKLVNVTVTGNKNVGGLVGKNSGTVSNSYSTGNVAGNEDVGGLVGRNEGTEATVSNSYSTGSVTGDENVGGLVGFNINRGTVSNSYSTGSVTGDDGVGGLVGRNYDGIVSNSHYNYNEVLINSKEIITIGALYAEDFEEWLAKDKFLDVNERLSEKDNNDYYLVSNVTAFKQLLAFGQDGSLKFRLKTNLDLSKDPNFYIPYFAGEFEGNFEGNDHKISKLTLDLDFVYNIGLFGYLAPGGRVTQVDVEDVDITGASYVGGLVGDNNGIVSNSYSSGSVTGDNYVGGLVGHNYRQGKVRNSYSNGKVYGLWGTGGLVGHNQGTVEKSYSTGSVSGGVLFILGDVVGGLVGFNEYIVRESYSTGSVTGDNYVGGLVGSNKYIVRESYSTGSVIGNNYVGGLVGANSYEVSDSYSTGSVTSEEGSYIGGLVGSNGDPGTVSDSYSTGSVSGNLHVGGLVGRNYGNVADSFWDEENSGMTDGVGTGDDTGITSKSEQEMKDIETYRATGWDIVKIEDYVDQTWYIDDGNYYPRLGWQKP